MTPHRFSGSPWKLPEFSDDLRVPEREGEAAGTDRTALLDSLSQPESSIGLAINSNLQRNYAGWARSEAEKPAIQSMFPGCHVEVNKRIPMRYLTSEKSTV